MTKISNPIQPPLDDLFLRLNLLNGLLFTLETQLNNFRRLIGEISEKENNALSYIGAGSALVIRDLTEWPENGWAKYYPSGVFQKRGEAYLQMGEVLLRRESAWTVSQAYEAFETFLKEITAKYLQLNKECVDTKKLTTFNSKHATSANPDDFQYWKNFVSYSNRKNINLLKFLRQIIPKLTEAEQRNNRPIDLREWYAVVEEVRHAVTHSNMVIKSKRMISWSSSKASLLNQYFPGNQYPDGYELRISRKDAEINLKLFIEYAFSIFKFLSISKNYNWNILIKK